MSQSSGLITVLQHLGVEGRLGETDGDQASLFGDDQAPRPLAPKGRSGPRGGRPPGARNRSTDEWARFLLARGVAPLPMLQDVLSWSVAELTDHLQEIADRHAYTSSDGPQTTTRRKVLIDPLAVLKLQAQIAETLALYTNKRQPVAVEVEERQRALVVLEDDIAGAEAGAEGFDELALQVFTDQQVSDAKVVGSDDERSDDEANALAGMGDRPRRR